MERMRTAEEMVEYCKRKGTASGKSRWSLKAHFSLIQEALGEDEYVMCCFAANYHVVSLHQGGETHVEALTNKRLLISRAGSMQSGISAIRYDDINEIKIVSDEVLIDTSKEVQNACVGYDDAKRIQQELDIIWPVIVREKEARERQKHFDGSIADELMKLADLKERRILTEKEFQQQKRLLLNSLEQESSFDEEEYQEADNSAPKKVYRVKRRKPVHEKSMDYEEMEERVLRQDVSFKAEKKKARKEKIYNGIRFCAVWILIFAVVIIYAVIKD